MKKVFLMIFIIVFSYPIVFAANMELQYDGEIHIYEGPNVNLILGDEVFVPSEGQMPPIIIQDRTLVPVKEVFEKLGGVVTWNADDRKVGVSFGEKEIFLWLDRTTALVNDKEVELDVPAKLINAKTMVPVRFISENSGLKVDWNGETTTVLVTKPAISDDVVKIKSVSYGNINNIDCIILDLDGDTTYNYFDLKPEGDRPYRIILDINNSKFDFAYETMSFAESELVSQIRFGVQENDVNRIVVDMRRQSDYSVIKDENDNKIYLVLDSNFTIEGKIPQTDIGENVDQNIDATKPVDDSPAIQEPIEEEPHVQEPIQEEPIANFTSNITSIKYSTASEKVRILFDDKFEYELTELENPKRIVLDFTKSALNLDGPSQITLKNKAVSTVEAFTNDDGSAKIIISMSKNASYELSKKTSELQVIATEPSYRNVEYTNKDSYAELILSNVDLDALTKLQSKNTKKYTIKYSSSTFDTGSGTIDVGDEYVKKISITNTKITITDQGNMKYVATQRGNDVVFTIKKASEQDEKIIILDAGHGGTDPGAINGSDNEKTFNLKIMLKLKNMLEDAGYTVYATREKDVTLSVNDRVYLATKDYPEASLYVSIHNNSLDNKNYSGTLVMYCDRDTSEYGITNKQFATYVLNELVDNLGTINRGFIEVKEDDASKRVLTEVPMPSILCEVAFVSNDEELARLKTSKFQSLAAEAIFNGIEKALNKKN